MPRALAGNFKSGFQSTIAALSTEQIRLAHLAAITLIQRQRCCGATKAEHLLGTMSFGVFISRPAPDIVACVVCRGWHDRQMEWRAILLDDRQLLAYTVCERCVKANSQLELERLVQRRVERIQTHDEVDI